MREATARNATGENVESVLLEILLETLASAVVWVMQPLIQYISFREHYMRRSI